MNFIEKLIYKRIKTTIIGSLEIEKRQKIPNKQGNGKTDCDDLDECLMRSGIRGLHSSTQTIYQLLFNGQNLG